MELPLPPLEPLLIHLLLQLLQISGAVCERLLLGFGLVVLRSHHLAGASSCGTLRIGDGDQTFIFARLFVLV